MNCNICQNQRVIYQDGQAKRCECLRLMNFKKFLAWSEAPKEQMKLLKDLEDKEMFIIVDDTPHKIKMKPEIDQLIKDRHANINDQLTILLKGTSGRGKTQMATTLSLEILKRMDLTTQDIDINKFFFFDPMTLIAENKLFDSERREDILRKVKQADVLIIDELGEELEMFKYDPNLKEYIPNDKRVNELHILLKRILDTFKGLLMITTNMEEPEKEYKKIAPRMYSRIFTEKSMVKYLFIGKGLDMRGTREHTNKDKYESRFKGENR